MGGICCPWGLNLFLMPCRPFGQRALILFFCNFLNPNPNLLIIISFGVQVLVIEYKCFELYPSHRVPMPLTNLSTGLWPLQGRS